MSRVIVIGGGIAGMGAARALLQGGASVALVDAGRRLGGNCFPVALPERVGGAPVTIDGGVSDVNRATFVHVARLLEELGVDVAPIGPDVSVADERGVTLWHQRAGALRPGAALRDAARLERELDRLRRELCEVLEEPRRFAGWTAGRYLDHRGYGEELVRVAFAPRARGCFAAPATPARAMSVEALAAFWRVHGIIGEVAPDRVCVRGGMHRYVDAFADWFVARGGELLLGRRAAAVRRRAGGVDVWLEDGTRLAGDDVILAGGARAALEILEDASAAESAALRNFRSQPARVVVHRDRALLPADRATWGAFNYLASGDVAGDPTVSFHVNSLAGLGGAVPDTFVTINPFRPPAPQEVLAERWILHPVADGATAARAAALAAARGPRVWFAGAHLREPWVHEAALVTGMRAAQDVLGAWRGRRRRAWSGVGQKQREAQAEEQ